MNCDQILETIAAYMIDKALGKTGSDLPDHILHHILSCSPCSAQMDVMLRILTGEHFRLSRPLLCDEVCDSVAEMAETDEDRVPFAFPAEWLHILSCPDCRDIYEMTRATLTPENELAFEAVRQAALPFSPAKPVIWDKIAPMLQKLTTELTILVSKGKDALALIPDWLATATLIPVPAEAYRSAGASGEYVQEVTIPDKDQNRQIVIRTRALEDKYLQLWLKVVDIDGNKCVGGIAVALLDGKGRYLMQMITPDVSGDDGFLEFPRCLPGHYMVRITEQGRSWEVSLHLG